MIEPSTQVFPFAFTPRQLIRMPYRAAGPYDMVRVCETDGTKYRIFNESWDGGCQDSADHALACALVSMGVGEWPDGQADLVAYSDAHGVWCLECGSGVFTGTQGGHCCPQQGCKNYNEANTPEWIKFLYNPKVA